MKPARRPAVLGQLIACRLRLFAIVPFACVVTAGVLPAQNDSAAVAATVASYHRALASGDSATALSLLADDAVILESGGIETRAEYRSHHLSSDIEFARSVKPVDGPLSVTVRGDVAWTTSTNVAQGRFRGRAVNSSGAELMVLTRIAGSWKIAAIHWSSRKRRP
jgi:ketosteroid isomerase-like protein